MTKAVQPDEGVIARTRALMRAVLAGAVLLSLLITAFAGYELFSRYERLHGEARRSLGLLNVALAEYTERTFLSFDSVLRDLRDDLAPLDLNKATDRAQAERELQNRLSLVSGFTAINLIAPNGRLVATSLPEQRESVDYSDRAYFIRQKEGEWREQSLIELPIFGRRSQRWAIPMTLRLEDRAGNFRGVLYAGIDIEALLGYYRSVIPFETGAAALFRADARLLARHPIIDKAFAADYAGIDLFRIHVPAAANGIYSAISSIDAVPRLVSYRSLPRFGLLVNVSLDERSILAEWRAQAWPVAAGAALALFFFALMTWLMLRQMRLSARQAQALHDSESLYRTLVDHLPIAVFLHRRNRILFANTAMARLLHAATPESLTGLPVMEEIIHPEDRELIGHRLKILIGGQELSPETLRFMTRGGLYSHVEETSALVHFAGERAILTLAQDVSERQELQARLTWQAHHDALTGLPNRFLFTDRLERAIETARRHERPLALLFVDFDHFKRINDTFGHLLGDEFLRQAAVRLGTTLRTSDTAARLGGDEFALLLAETSLPEDARTVAAKILAAFAQPFMLDGRAITVTASIGMALFPRDGASASALMACADAAMYYAKESGRNLAHAFDQQIGERVKARLTLENALRQALFNEELSLVFQPIVSADGVSARSAEALLRWKHPELGQVAPDLFIPVAEETGLIVPIGDWVLRQSCARLCAWEQATGQKMRVAINVSARQFEETHFAEQVIAILDEYRLSPDRVELEITERLLIEPRSAAAANLQRLHEHGIALSLDDFGTGYSSLSFLSQTPVSILKIDRSFVSRLGTQSADTALIVAIIAIAKSLGLKTIAEGVETAAQQTHLAGLGVDLLQGYHNARPLVDADLIDWLRRH